MDEIKAERAAPDSADAVCFVSLNVLRKSPRRQATLKLWRKGVIVGKQRSGGFWVVVFFFFANFYMQIRTFLENNFPF